MGIAGGYGAAADGGGGSDREADRRGAVYDQRADSSSFTDCRTRREERRTESRHGAHGEGFDWAHDFRNSALSRVAGRSRGFSPQDGISREGSSGTVGSIVSEDAIAFPDDLARGETKKLSILLESLNSSTVVPRNHKLASEGEGFKMVRENCRAERNSWDWRTQ